ncbi:MAG: hypothetical protein K2G75_02980 [Muribaculaceae bacterium]|nr:hypothetical protein [Muribaculaceae bacterium]MDE5924266.1 hypothetical protein [Muribaculaceae bacterium]MDE6330633.1 hypothetical protein [Muribaculaceae bacterium]
MSGQLEYDEDMAIAFIRREVGDEVSRQYSDDEILYVIDIIWDYYERKGLLKLNPKATADEQLDEEALTAYVRKELSRDGEILMDPDDLDKIVKAELDYEESLEDA